MPLTEETTCGFWFLKGSFMQKMANKNVYVVVYGVLGSVYGATFAYFNGTITTLEKLFQIPSRTSGLITTGIDIYSIFGSIALSYYAGRGHRPRWLAFGTTTLVVFCLMATLPHAIYGPGNDALQLTEEYGQDHDANETLRVLENQRKRTLCQQDGVKCEEYAGSIVPQVILFMAHLIGGIGDALFLSLGVSYLDDNTEKSKTPILISVSYFMRLLGPALGYALASFCLKMYVSPTLTPTIGLTDPRWRGAWWLGWIILGCTAALLAVLIGMFPKTLPRAAVRRAIAQESNNQKEVDEQTSWSDMYATIMRLLKNKTYVYDSLSSIFYCFGYNPYWVFMAKYIETQFRQSASVASFVTGTVGLVFSAIGILVSGVVLSYFKPRARLLAAWNVIAGAIAVSGMIYYVYLGCDDNLSVQLSHTPSGEVNYSLPCNEECFCDFVAYSPVCSEEGETFISPCHAGCRSSEILNGSKVFTQCSCVRRSSVLQASNSSTWGVAFTGNCPVDCTQAFYTFLAVVCLLKFVGATGRATNFLVGVRCIDEKDKTVSIGFSISIHAIFAFIPSPILFGYILDTTCIVWGKNCSGTGNCWLYDGYKLRYVMNLTAASLVAIGTLFDAVVWYYVKDLKIFDDDEVDLKSKKEAAALVAND